MRNYLGAVLALAVLLVVGACNVQSQPGQHAGADTPMDDERNEDVGGVSY